MDKTNSKPVSDEELEEESEIEEVIEKDGSGYWVDWDDSIEPFPSADKINAASVISTWNRVRKVRNELLAATDFYALSDVVMSDDMTTYRQALRDVPTSVENSEDVVWPEKPS